jgi:hypothetical protein
MLKGRSRFSCGVGRGIWMTFFLGLSNVFTGSDAAFFPDFFFGRAAVFFPRLFDRDGFVRCLAFEARVARRVRGTTFLDLRFGL